MGMHTMSHVKAIIRTLAFILDKMESQFVV